MGKTLGESGGLRSSLHSTLGSGRGATSRASRTRASETIMRSKAKLTIAGMITLLLFTPRAWGQNLKPVAGQIGVPNRVSAPLFKGEQGKQRTEIHFDPVTGR